MNSVRGVSCGTSSFATGRDGVGGCEPVRDDASICFGVPCDGGELGGPGGCRPGCGALEGAGRLVRNACTIGRGFSIDGIRVTVEPGTC